jgi:V8-like Glu-specific endopeptidase
MEKFKKSLTVVAIVSVILTTGPSPKAMTGGDKSKDSKFGAIVSFYIEKRNSDMAGFCSGTFIAPNLLLTAAHCFYEFIKPNEFAAIKIAQYPNNSYTRSQALRTFTNVKVYTVPGFKMNTSVWTHPDLAVVEFPGQVSTSFLPLSFLPVTSQDQLVYAGYGCDKKTHEEITDFKFASKHMAKRGRFVVGVLKDDQSKACPGDSGGPFLIDSASGLSIVGVMSYINPVGTYFSNSQDRFARMNSQTEPRVDLWLQAVMAHGAQGQIFPSIN